MPNERKKRPFILIILIAMVLFFVFGRGWITPFESIVLRVFSPIATGSAQIVQSVQGYVFSFLRVGTLSRAVRILENKNAKDEAIISRFSGVEIENKVLREQLRLLPKDKYKILSADVVGHSTDGARDTPIINRGNSDGIKEDMPVIVNDGVVVGKIFRADAMTSILMLLTDADFRLAAAVQGTKAQGLVRGEKGLDVSMDGIPRGEEIKIGERVVTTGVDGLFPADLLVGKIRSIEAPQNEIFQTAKVTPVLDIRQLYIVSVITGK